MHERNKLEVSSGTMEVRLMGIPELCSYISLGKTAAVEFAKGCGAERKIGRRSLFDKKIIDQAIDQMSQGDSTKA